MQLQTAVVTLQLRLLVCALVPVAPEFELIPNNMSEQWIYSSHWIEYEIPRNFFEGRVRMTVCVILAVSIVFHPLLQILQLNLEETLWVMLRVVLQAV